eukprot:1004272-Pyramimonas_sp.AAC.1
MERKARSSLDQGHPQSEVRADFLDPRQRWRRRCRQSGGPGADPRSQRGPPKACVQEGASTARGLAQDGPRSGA